MKAFRILFSVGWLFILSKSQAELSSPVVKIKNFHRVNESLYRSGLIESQLQYRFFKQLGIQTVLSLESYIFNPQLLDQEREWAKAEGVEFLHIPMSANPIDVPTLAEIHAILDVVVDPNQTPMLVHCYNGSDRTGLIVAAYRRKYDGWSADEAIDEMRRYGHHPIYYHWDHLVYLIQPGSQPREWSRRFQKREES